MTVSILHVSQPVTEGVARWVAQLAADQHERGWNVTVACPSDGWLATELRDVGVAHVAWEATRSPSPSVLSEVKTLRAIIKRVQPDVVHLHSSKAGLAGRLAIRKARKTVFQPHCWSFNAVIGPVALLTKGWERLAARWTDRIVCVSESERDEGSAIGIKRDVLHVIPNGIDPDRWPFADEAKRQVARFGRGLSPEASIAVVVGRLSHQKGQDLLLAAWPSIRESVPNALLYLVGDGPDRVALENVAKSLRDVHFVGTSDAVASWLAAANVVVLPSRWEGMALSVLEAAGTGRSVVATDVQGMREVVGDKDDAGGAVVPLDDAVVQGLTAALAERLGDASLADTEGRRGRARVEAAFTLRKSLDDTASMTSSLLGQ